WRSFFASFVDHAERWDRRYASQHLPSGQEEAAYNAKPYAYLFRAIIAQHLLIANILWQSRAFGTPIFSESPRLDT
ncbi:MAG: hypothetical protein KBH35_03065, partial [Bifidobacterium sp.]|nr:hypothetical protein [Bifidobacterium sp.]